LIFGPLRHLHVKNNRQILRLGGRPNIQNQTIFISINRWLRDAKSGWSLRTLGAIGTCCNGAVTIDCRSMWRLPAKGARWWSGEANAIILSVLGCDFSQRRARKQEKLWLTPTRRLVLWCHLQYPHISRSPGPPLEAKLCCPGAS
jgi:hypothetical protein